VIDCISGGRCNKFQELTIATGHPKRGSKSAEIFSAFDELRDSPVLSQQEKTLDRLSDEGTLMIMAGMCSSKRLLSCIL
jgi:hypothetical protein